MSREEGDGLEGATRRAVQSDDIKVPSGPEAPGRMGLAICK